MYHVAKRKFILMEMSHMKKLICLTVALLLCVSLACPIFAAEEFVPSISYKGTPEVVTVTDPEGKEAVGVTQNAEGEITGYIYEECMWLTPVALAKDDQKIPDEDEKVLLSVYEALTKGTMKLPYGEGINPEEMVIRDLFNVGWLCGHDHDALLEPIGVVAVLTFDLGVEADEDVIVMTYKNNTWNEIADVKNNGDGTVTCTFENFCPVSFSVKSKNAGAPDDTGDLMGTNLYLWIALMSVATVAMVAVVVTRRKVR